MNESFTGRSIVALRRWTCGILAAGVLSAAAPFAYPCPFCNAAMQTLSQEIESADVALIAELVEPMPTSLPDAAGGVAGEAVAAAKFRVVDVLRGADQLVGRDEIDVVYFGEEPSDRKFLITGLAGVTGPGLDWTTPVPLSEAAVDYVRRLLTVPAEGADRLAFFQNYLEHDDPLLAQDAYDEFARTPYAEVVELGPRIKREQILQWIGDANVGPSRRRLYLTLLGICGKPDDVQMLEQLMNYDHATMRPGVAALIATSAVTAPPAAAGLLDEMLKIEESRKRESLDALIACYLKLKGADGLVLINELFFANSRVQYRYLHAAIMALRFHGEETDVLPREKLLESMRLALDHRDFADQVIPDLTRWEDWEVMPRLVTMFKESPTDDWIRQPVASYLLVAAEQPGDVGEGAAAALAELETIDKETVERARSLSAFGFLARAAAPPAAETTEGASSADAEADVAADSPVSDVAARAAAPVGEPALSLATDASPAPEGAVDTDDSAPPEASSADDPLVPEAGATEEVVVVAAADGDSRPSPLVAATTVTPPSRIKIIGVPLIAAAVLLAIFAVLLRGADPRSSDENP
jgi:hypothetical protein